MRRLNTSRVGFKHSGTLPSTLDIEAYRGNLTSCFQDNTPLVFGVNFDDISLVDLVACADAKGLLFEAKEALENTQWDEASIKIALAFVELVDDYENRKLSRYGRSPFFFGREMGLQMSLGSGFEGKARRSISEMHEAIEAIQSAVKILSLGLDYPKYSRFRMYTPEVLKTLSGNAVRQGPFEATE